MRKIVVIILFSHVCSTVIAQSLGISGGLNYNKFYENKRKHSYSSSNFQSDYGYSAIIGLSDIYVDSLLPLKFTLGFDTYSGKVYIAQASPGGGSATEASLTKSTIGLGFFPLNFTIKKLFFINLGVEFEYLLNAKITGYQRTWSVMYTYNYYDLNNRPLSFNNKYSVALICNIGINIPLSQKISVFAQYNVHLGLKGEFIGVESSVGTFRQLFALGIALSL